MRRRWRRVDKAMEQFQRATGGERYRAMERVSRALGSRHSLPQPSRRQIDQVFWFFAQIALHDQDPELRQGAAYELTFWGERRAGAVLLRVFEKTGELGVIRGQAAEGVGGGLAVWWTDPIVHSPLRERAVAALRQGLGEVDPQVRFWCIYALGHMLAREARPAIEALVSDQTMCPHLWLVGDEAQDVLSYWDTGDWPDRDFR